MSKTHTDIPTDLLPPLDGGSVSPPQTAASTDVSRIEPDAGPIGSPRTTSGPGTGRVADPTPDPDPGPGRRRVSWRQAMAAGLTCFAVWLLLDAPTLQRSAQAAPFGTRRTVALDVLGPVASLSRTLGVAHVVGGADRALGRTGPSVVAVSGGPPQAGGPPPTPPIGPLPHRAVRVARPGATPPGLPPLPTPTAAAPLGVLVIGDSIGIDLGESLVNDLAQTGVVHAELDGRVDTGLARPDYFNWPAEVTHDLAQYHPGAVVVMLGANDPQNFVVGGQALTYGTPAWAAAYGARVAGVMQQITASGARGLWIGMPPMADPRLNGEMQSLNTIFESQAHRHPGVDYFSAWPVLSDPQGAFATYLPDASGAEVNVRTPDGTHLSPGGAARLAGAVVTAMNNRWGLHLRP